jgi:hypothetical protein
VLHKTPPTPKPTPVHLAAVIDPDAPRGDLVPVLAQLLRKLRDRDRAEAQTARELPNPGVPAMPRD